MYFPHMMVEPPTRIVPQDVKIMLMGLYSPIALMDVMPTALLANNVETMPLIAPTTASRIWNGSSRNSSCDVIRAS